MSKQIVGIGHCLQCNSYFVDVYKMYDRLFCDSCNKPIVKLNEVNNE